MNLHVKLLNSLDIGQIIQTEGKTFQVELKMIQHSFSWKISQGIKAFALTILTGSLGAFFSDYIQNLWREAFTGIEKVKVLKELSPTEQKIDGIVRDQLQDQSNFKEEHSNSLLTHPNKPVLERDNQSLDKSNQSIEENSPVLKQNPSTEITPLVEEENSFVLIDPARTKLEYVVMNKNQTLPACQQTDRWLAQSLEKISDKGLIKSNLVTLINYFAENQLNNLNKIDWLFLYNVLFDENYKRDIDSNLNFSEMAENLFEQLFDSYQKKPYLATYLEFLREDLGTPFSSAVGADKIRILWKTIKNKANQQEINLELTPSHLFASNLEDFIYSILDKQAVLMPEVTTTQELWQKLQSCFNVNPEAKFIKYSQAFIFIDIRIIQKILEEKPIVPLQDLFMTQEISCINQEKLRLNGFERLLLSQQSAFFSALWKGSFKESYLQQTIELDCSSTFLQYAIAHAYKPINFRDQDDLSELYVEAKQREFSSLQSQVENRFKEVISHLTVTDLNDQESIKNIFSSNDEELILCLLKRLNVLACTYETSTSLNQQEKVTAKKFIEEDFFALINSTQIEKAKLIDHLKDSLNWLSGDQIVIFLKEFIDPLEKDRKENKKLKEELTSLKQQEKQIFGLSLKNESVSQEEEYENIQARKIEIKEDRGRIKKQKELKLKKIKYVLSHIKNKGDEERRIKLFQILKHISLSEQSSFSDIGEDFRLDSRLCQIQAVLAGTQAEKEKKKQINKILNNVSRGFFLEDEENIKVAQVLGLFMGKTPHSEQVRLLSEVFSNRGDGSLAAFASRILQN
jgi:hypothetical protein